MPILFQVHVDEHQPTDTPFDRYGPSGSSGLTVFSVEPIPNEVKFDVEEATNLPSRISFAPTSAKRGRDEVERNLLSPQMVSPASPVRCGPS